MSDENQEQEEDANQEETLDLVETDDDADELEVDESDEIDELEEVVEEKAPEKGAYLVIGQGEFNTIMSNRGADDPGDNTLSAPQGVCKFGDMLFVSDRGNHRVLVWDQFPEENGEPSSVVLGQEDFADCLENRGITTTLDEMTSGLGDENLEGFTISKAEEDTLSQPDGISVIDGKLYIVDGGNHRVVRWSGLPSEDGEPPNLVMGQDNLDENEANRQGLVGSGSLFFPMGICSGDDQHVFVADKDNHRVLIWKKVPFSDGWNADISLGQPGMDERDANRGDFDNVQQDTLSFPTGVFFDAENEKVFVVDQGNNRVLIWNSLPRDTGQPADVVVGQKDFVSRGPNMGKGDKRASMDSLYFPTDIVVGQTGMYVSDTGNNRVLYWKEVPTENGQPADLVFGQTNFTDKTPNRFAQANASTLNDPHGLWLEEEENPEWVPPDEVEEAGDSEEVPEEVSVEEGADDNETEEIPEYLFKLFIADRGNSRVVVWNELPVMAGDEEEIEDNEIDIEDPNLLIGEDDEDDYLEQEEDSTPEELPST
ncbi:MAG TPA: NHL repeat-containing protein [Nitrospinaceae bacterium]|nr:NHL repeat-containing protein [Nitrospinaceae bacterium]